MKSLPNFDDKILSFLSSAIFGLSTKSLNTLKLLRKSFKTPCFQPQRFLTPEPNPVILQEIFAFFHRFCSFYAEKSLTFSPQCVNTLPSLHVCVIRTACSASCGVPCASRVMSRAGIRIPPPPAVDLPKTCISRFQF